MSEFSKGIATAADLIEKTLSGGYYRSMIPEMKEMIDEARQRGLWLHCAYQDIWFSPDELVSQQDKGRFRWGPVNWELRNPREQVDYLTRRVEQTKTELENFKARAGVA